MSLWDRSKYIGLLDLTFGAEVGVLKSLSSGSGLKTLCKFLKG
jgi:hypothetical protein